MEVALPAVGIVSGGGLAFSAPTLAPASSSVSSVSAEVDTDTAPLGAAVVVVTTGAADKCGVTSAIVVVVTVAAAVGVIGRIIVVGGIVDMLTV